MGVFMGAAMLAAGFMMVAIARGAYRHPERLGIFGGLILTEFYAVAVTTLMAFGAIFVVRGILESGSVLEGLAAVGVAFGAPIVLARLFAGRRQVMPHQPA